MKYPLDSTVLCSVLVTCLAAAGCSDANTDATGSDTPVRERPLVITTFYPTEYLVERLAGEWVNVRCDVPGDADALFWKPSDEQVLEYQKADLIVLNGAGMETWVEHMSLPLSRVVDTSRAFEDRFVDFEAATHSHGGGEDHTHSGTDPHIWLDPLNVEQQALALHSALKLRLPDHEADLQANMDALSADLKSVHESYLALGKGVQGVWMYASHPAYNYLASRYGWKIVNLDLDPEQELADAQLNQIRDLMQDKAGQFILWESEPLASTVDRLRSEVGLESVTVTPCELMSAEERASGSDFLGVLRANGEVLGRALSQE
ncbi:MAG: zinc transport system substrate-binding protein [Planctomycetota bacterium]|jgi:zinc transport system substrate-binding protein